MFWNNLKRLRPEASIFLASLAIAAAAACGGDDATPPGTPQPIGGQGGTGAGSTPGAAGGTGTQAGTPGGQAATQGGTPGAQPGTQGGTPGAQPGTQGGTPGAQPGTQGGTPGGSTDAGATPGGSDAGTPDGGTAGGTAGGGMAMNFPGKATGCSSYGAAMLPNKCAGYYCNLSLAMLTPALGTVGKCTGFTAEDVCKGELTKHVGECAREVKSADTLANPLSPSPNSVLRPMVEACVRAKRTDKYEKVNMDCMGCFLNAAECAGDKCLIDCLAGDSAGCDSCRMRNNCNQPVPTCGGLPNPF